MATVNIALSSPQTVTISPASTASSSTLLGGRESNEIDNTSTLYADAILEGFITVGTTPTANTLIQICVWGSHTSAATTNLDVIDGVDSAETITSSGIREGFLKIVSIISVDATTSDRKYNFNAGGIAAYFNGVMPRYWGVFVTHNTGVNLNATSGNHEIKFTGVTYTVA
jgi:hypothetical protein